jgi:hypothetical protein
MFSLNLNYLLPWLNLLRELAAPRNEPPPPRELQRMLDELRLTREREESRALTHRLFGR